METKRTLHSVRIRDDLWNVLTAWINNDHNRGIQDFFEEAIKEKLGLEGNINEEIQERNKEITKLQELNRLSEEFLKSNNKKEDVLEDTRKKALKGLLTTNLKEWTPMNKKHAIKVGKFKDRAELESWVLERQKD